MFEVCMPDRLDDMWETKPTPAAAWRSWQRHPGLEDGPALKKGPKETRNESQETIDEPLNLKSPLRINMGSMKSCSSLSGISRVVLRVLVLAICLELAWAQSITLKKNYTGSDFFDAWNYQTGKDDSTGPLTRLFGIPPTMGNVNWTSQQFANENNLTSVNVHGNVVIKVDNSSSGSPSATFLRNSVLLVSKDTINFGDLVVMDLLHSPFGCSVWPSFWMTGQKWPTNGQIDLINNANMESTSQYTLKTSTDGCTHPAEGLVNETGSLISPNCAYDAVKTTNLTNGGCVVEDNLVPAHLAFGVNFANNGGGIFAMLWNSLGIKHPDPSGWPAPVAFFPASSCNPSQFFGPQNMILQTNICGTFAEGSFLKTCQGNCIDLVGDAANYAKAYWEIKSLAIFSSDSAPASNNTTPTGQSHEQDGKMHVLAPAIGGALGGLALILAIGWAFLRHCNRRSKHRHSDTNPTSIISPFFHQPRFSAQTSSTDRVVSKKQHEASSSDNIQLSSPVTPVSTQRSSRFRVHEDSGADIVQPEQTEIIDLPPIYDTVPVRRTIPGSRVMTA